MNVRLGNLVSCSFSAAAPNSSIQPLTHLIPRQLRRPNHCIIKLTINAI